MSASFKAVWLGDGDPQAQMVRMGDVVFVKGESVTVKGDHDFAERIKSNPTFAVGDAKAEPVEVEEPDTDLAMERAEEGTEKGSIKKQLRAMGIEVKGNPSLDTLRNRLVDATK